MWKKDESFKNFVDTLYESGRNGLTQVAKRAKSWDEIHTCPLAWGETKFVADEIRQFAWSDQMFREVILVNQITKEKISIFSGINVLDNIAGVRFSIVIREQGQYNSFITRVSVYFCLHDPDANFFASTSDSSLALTGPFCSNLLPVFFSLQIITVRPQT